MGAMGTMHADGIRDGGAAGMSPSGIVSPPHFTQTAFQWFQSRRQDGHQRPSRVPPNTRNDPWPVSPASPPTSRRT